MFSTTDKYYVFASEVASDKTGSSAWAKGTVNNNGTVTDIDLDTDMTYTGTQVTATTAAETGGVEEICNKGADANAKSTNWGNIKAPTS